MKNKLILILTSFLTACNSSQPSYTPLTTPTLDPADLASKQASYETSMDFVGEAWFDQHEVFSINEMDHRSNFYYYDSIQRALDCLNTSMDDLDYKSSQSYLDLNGEWAFYYSDKPKNRLRWQYGSDITTYTEEWDVSTFETIELPNSYQTIKNADGSFKYDKPLYTNITYPWIDTESIQYAWDGAPVAPTSFNSVTHYKKSFDITKEQLNQTALLHIQGISSAYYVYINGQCVGYSEDSYTDSYFDISSYLKQGENTIAFEVYKYSDGSYLENQDMIRLSGIFRDISIEFTSKSYIYDIVTTQDFSNGIDLNTSITINSSQANQLPLYISLYDINGELVANSEQLVSLNEGSQIIDISLKDLKIELWNIDDPNLYTLVVSLDECIAGLRVGFRELTWDDEFIYINGHKILLNGINRHEMDPNTGKVLTNETIINELLLIKDSNINSIRLAHYPNNNLTYDIADELGLLLIDEANIESHGGEIELKLPGNNPKYIPEMIDRYTSMVKRDRNHPSVIIYSYGNESTYQEYPLDDNYGFYQLAKLSLKLDDSRLRMYERDNRYMEGNREESMVDIASTQYYEINDMKQMANNYDIPYLQQEYAHAMGNGLGNFKEYNQAIKESYCAGGFVWDFKDQSIYTTINDKKVFGHGGDWDSLITNDDFCGNGIVYANGIPSPELYDLKQVYQLIDIDLKDSVLTFTNNYPTLNLNQLDIHILELNEGNIINNTQIQLECSPNDTVNYPLDLENGENHHVLQIYVTHKNESIENWIAYQQFELNDLKPTHQKVIAQDSLTVNETDSLITVSSDNGFNYQFDKTSGLINSIAFKDEILMENMNNILLYRTPVSNDPTINQEILKETYPGKVKVKSIVNKDNLVTIQFEKKLDNLDAKTLTKYTLNSEGTIEVNNQIKVGDFNSNGPLLAIAYQSQLPLNFEEVIYYGNGEVDCYIDRNNACAYGNYGFNVNNQPTYDLVPQTNYHKYNVSYLNIYNDKYLLNFTFNQPISFTYNNHSAYQLATASHTELIEDDNYHYLTIELAHRGLGNGSWGPQTLDPYIINDNQTYELSYTLDINIAQQSK